MSHALGPNLDSPSDDEVSMASVDIGLPRRSRRPRARRARPPPPPATSLPQERLPLGTLSSARSSVSPHIQIVSRDSEDSSSSQLESEGLSQLVNTNPSYLTETDLGRDLHQRDSGPLHSSFVDDSHYTFADMARAGLGPREYSDHMASQEPVALGHYVKFKRPKNRKGAHSPFHEDMDGKYSDSEVQGLFNNDRNIVFKSEASFSKDNDVTSSNARGLSGNGKFLNPATADFRLSRDPVALFSTQSVDQLQEHFALVRYTMGRELPDANHLAASEGQRDGEVQLTMDESGDIFAHSWDAAKFHWVNVGLFSYRRGSIEGALGVRQLKGQKIGSQMPRNKIELFAVLARQFEEENSITSISPTGYMPRAARGMLVAKAEMPLVSPRPQRPAVSVTTKEESAGSFSSVVLGSQRPGLSTIQQLAAQPGSELAYSKASDGNAAIISTSKPSVTLESSSSSSGTNVSPVSRRPGHPSARPRAPVESLRPDQTFGVSGYNAPSAGGIYEVPGALNLSETHETQRQQLKLWQDDQIQRRKPEQGNGFLGQYSQAWKTQASAASEDHETSDSVGLFKPYDNDTKHRGEPRDPSSWSIVENRRNPVETWAQQTRLPDGLAWGEIGRSIPSNWADLSILSATAAKTGTSGFFADRTGADDERTSPGCKNGEKPDYMSLADIGSSDADVDWEARQMAIYGMRPGMATNRTNEELLEEMNYYRPGNLNGPFFTDAESRTETTDLRLSVKERAEFVMEAQKTAKVNRADWLRSQSRLLHVQSGVSVDDDNVERMATDPLSQLIWGVRLGMAQYQQPDHLRDHWQRQFKPAKPEHIDTGPNADNSFFSSSAPTTSDEVVYKGRLSRPGALSRCDSGSSSAPREEPGLVAAGIEIERLAMRGNK